MKSYRGSKSIHMAGQAWQIRAVLKQWLKQWGPQATVRDMLHHINSVNTKKDTDN